jgi:hypothetical protein
LLIDFDQIGVKKMGVFNLTKVDTTPGVGGIFSLEDNQNDYVEEMKKRYRSPSWKQRFDIQVHFINKPTTQRPQVIYSGPYVEEAKRILKKLGAKIK